MGKNPKIVQCLLQTLKIITYVYFLKSGREAEMGRKISVLKNVDFSLYCIIFLFLAPPVQALTRSSRDRKWSCDMSKNFVI